MLTRRGFIKTLGMFGGVILTPLGRLVRWLPSGLADTETPSAGELYAGFVLLPEDAPIPSFVQCAPAPILCQVDNEHDPVVMTHRGETIGFDSIEELISNVSFRTYVPTLLPADMTFIHGQIIRFVQSRKVFEASMNFGFPDNRQPLVSVSARPVFPRPYPVWPVHSPPVYESQTWPEQDDIVVSPEKVGFTPAPGLMLPTADGHLLHWIRQNILYTLIVEHDRRRDAVEDIAQSLVEI